ncbi:uncharacterized protein B0I36DRAFT_321001 [Microdochium trichocladiopsis]|uniref:Aprataxin-like protein n=1 Tax=Microdochium trichocladiopsis TaxID=1682393 RepID=A0A9P9BRV8_9PEZI|nr:uncharacterized protein B0I36DRAFT_321001 [Microdochium trichocladiopsis]KAH7033220.1 hypothetical protein B0I36DRAFT_321001 [Microdochium trichocladiopsis]
MASHDSDAEEAMTQEEIEGTAPAPTTSTPGVSQSTKRNAFTELMSPKTKVPARSPATANFYSRPSIKLTSLNSRDGLGVYIADPASFPASRVIYHNDDFVAINDMYPKSSVHTLLLPRSAKWNRLHPFDAFASRATENNNDNDNDNDGTAKARADFLASVQTEALRLKQLVAKELQRKFGKFSAQDSLRESILNGETEWDAQTPLPQGRDWEKEVLVGIHARPSMNHLHVHVLSRDMFSECLRHRKHYNSFNTGFLIDVADFPLAEDDKRLHPGAAGFMDSDLRCWRCGRNFGNKFKQLKEHLAEEFEAWKRE